MDLRRSNTSTQSQKNPRIHVLNIHRERQTDGWMDGGQARSSKSVKAERTGAGISISPSQSNYVQVMEKVEKCYKLK